jgi:hypothetical protein
LAVPPADGKTGEVFKLLKLLVSLVCLGAFVWWGLTVQLGAHTLFGHIAAIGASKESKDLVRGTKDKVADLKKHLVADKADPGKELEVTGEVHSAGAGKPASQPEDRLTNADRRDMKRLLDKRGKAAAGTPN